MIKSPSEYKELTMKSDQIEAVRKVLQRFQDGYTARDVDHLDGFMDPFRSTGS